MTTPRFAMKFETIRPALIAAAICGTGGAIFFFLHAPLPWMLGSLTAAAIVAILGGGWFIPAVARGVARPVVGVLAGSGFSAAVVTSIPGWWSAILLVVVQSLAVTLLGYVFFRKIGRFDRQTAFFAGTPGGLGEMALLGDSLGGNVRSIVISHSIRILVVIFTMPFILQLIIGHPIGRILPTSPGDIPPTSFDWTVLALCAIGGYGIARVIKFSAGMMVFPMLLSAVAHGSGVTQAVPPAWLVAAVQVVIGGIVGARFAGIRWREMRRTIVFSTVWAFAMIAMAALAAYASTWLIDRPFQAMVLALAPGGTIEMTILTFSVGIEVAFVVTSQVCRILFVLVMVPMLFKMSGISVKPLGSGRGDQ